MAETNPVSYPFVAWDILQHLFEVGKMNDHTLHFSATFAGRLDYERLKKAVDLSADVFPLIRCRFAEEGRRPRWVDMGFTSDDMVTLAETEHKEEAIQKFLCRKADLNGPQLKVGVLRNTGDTLCVTINHMLCDAAGFKEFLYLLCSLYNGMESSPEYQRGSAVRNRRLKQVLKSFSVSGKAKIFLRKNDLIHPDQTTFNFEGNLKNPFIEIRSIPQDDFRRLKAYAKAHGATVNDVMLAAFFRALYRKYGRVFACPCTVDLRKHLPGRKADGITNLVTMLVCDIGPEPGASFEDTLKKVNTAMNLAKSDTSSLKSILLLEMLFSFMPYRKARKLLEKKFSNAPIAFTNIGILNKGLLHFDGIIMESAFMSGSIKYAPHFQVALSTFDDEAVLSVNLYGSVSDRKLIADFLDDFVGELNESPMK
ncbi:MAG TPA: hypothetical protein VHP31_11505 [Caproicibacter sp.]|nr:hypothetical protein [Caproicibacter sp.]